MIIGAPRGIAFIRVFPDQSLKAQTIERPAEIDLLAAQFIARGGRYFIAAISANEVRLAAFLEAPNGDVYELASEVSPDGVMLPLAVDRLVRESARKIAVV